jgi:outer membrane protein insertion porin family
LKPEVFQSSVGHFWFANPGSLFLMMAEGLYAQLMKSRQRRRLVVAFLLACALTLLVSAQASAQQQQDARQLVGLQANESAVSVSQVTIFSDGVLNDYQSYQEGDQFRVVIPHAQAISLKNGLSGRGFKTVRVEQSGDDLSLSFLLREGFTASLSRKFNRLDVIFSLPVKKQASAAHALAEVAAFASRAAGLNSNAALEPSVVPVLTVSALANSSTATPRMGEYEGRPIGQVEIVFEGSPADAAAEAEFRSLLVVARGDEYSAVRVRDSLQALFDSEMVSSARVEAHENACPQPPGAPAGQSSVCLRFVIKRQVRVSEVVLGLSPATGSPVSEDELRARLNMLDPGARVSETTLKNNADLIQAYLRDRGFFRAEVEYTTRPDPNDRTGTRAIVAFQVKLNEQARVGPFNINVQGFDPSRVRPQLSLQTGSPFTRQALGEDLTRIRQAIIAQGYLAPQLDEQVTLDSTANQISVTVKGGVGPKVGVKVNGYALKGKVERELLPIEREGTIDYSAVVEGERRLRNKLQEEGYFFAEVEAVCSVAPPLPTTEQNGTKLTCENLNPVELTGRTVQITYNVERGRRFKLTDIRIEGTDLLTIEDVEADLKTQEANLLSFVPVIGGYGRGYTSAQLLVQDQRLIRARMQDLGYRRADVTVRQGVSLDGENLIITFVVDQKELTRVAGVEIRGNQIYTEGVLRDQLQGTVVDGPFSRSVARADGDKILNLYARDGYINARLDFSIVELPKKKISDTVQEEQVRVVYTISNEGDKVFINRIIVNGNILTRREAITEAIPLVEGEVLRLDKLTDSERILYETDAFRQVIIRTEPAGENQAGFKKHDVIIDVEELKPRIREYGGGYSTDNGPLGFFDIRHVNLFGKLRQGTARLRFSRRQQLLRFEYFDPRYQRYGDNQFAPLAVSVQYQRDSTITRFFRTTIDRGNLGIVQRLDEDGNPIDEFGERTGEPTINRFTFNIETQRVIDRDTRSILFLRYSYEDVRLFDIGSLLLADILRPDRAIRTSGLGVAFVRDTRERCVGNLSRLVRASLPAGTTERCEYSATDATTGDYLTVNYGLSLRQLGGNISFNKFFGNYRRYYQLPRARNTVLAASITLGLGNVFNPRDRDGDGVIDEDDLTLPISERFFSGGSTTLRGFGYEEAGPREAVFPTGIFRDRQGDPIVINPFLVPTGGNALAIVNLEARLPLTKLFQVVPFYDGGNVFRRIGDLFGRRPEFDPRDIEASNLRANWTNTVGLGVRIRTPIGGALAIDYGILLDPPEFILLQGTPPGSAPPAVIRLKKGQLHFRFTQTF